MIRLSLRILFLISALAATASFKGLAVAQTQDRGRSLDQKLLDDLDRELLQGLPSAKSPAASSAGSDKGASDRAETSDEPIAKIAERMRAVQSRMARGDTRATTQSEQSQILADLDALLEEANKSRPTDGNRSPGAGAQAGTGNGAVTPAAPRDSTDRIERGDVEATGRADAKDVLRRAWGHLPEKLRDEMQASFSEQFLPKYERLIEEYYKRLAEERPATP